MSLPSAQGPAGTSPAPTRKSVSRFAFFKGGASPPSAAATATAVHASLESSDECAAAASSSENVYDAPDDGQVLVMRVDAPATIYVRGSKRAAASSTDGTAPLISHETAPASMENAEMWRRVWRSFIFSSCLFMVFICVALILHTYTTRIDIQYGNFILQWHDSSLDKGR